MDGNGLVCLVLLLVFAVAVVSPLIDQPTSAASVSDARSQQQNTDLMQQSDFSKRRDKQKETRTIEKQMASVATAENGSRSLDYVVLILLAASVTAVLLLSKPRFRGRRYRRRL
jgi:hypothetical protein